MKKLLFLLFSIPMFGKGQVLCIYCYDQIDSISQNVSNLLINGGFENTSCINNNDCFCPSSSSFNCNIGNWICTGGGPFTYSRIYNNNYSIVPQGNRAAYFGNDFCYPCSFNLYDTTCLISNGCSVAGIPNGFPSSKQNFGGASGVSLHQTASGLVIGDTYVLEFWVGGENLGAFPKSGLFAVDVGFGNIFLRNRATMPHSTDVGTRYLIEFNATSVSHTITFTNWGHICYDCTELVLDDVRLYSLLYLSQSVPLCAGANIISHFSAPNHLCKTCTDFTNLSHNATSYQWFFPGATPDTSTATNPTNICYPNLGNYNVTLIATGVAGSDTLTLTNYITVVDSPQSSFSGNPLIFCAHSNTDFTNLSSNAYTYQWSFPGGTPSTFSGFSPQNILYDSAGLFDVTLISSNNGCSDTLTLPDYITVNAVPQTSFLASTLDFCPGGCIDFINSSTNATTYQWSFPGATIDTSTLENPTSICYNASGQYEVVLITSNGDCMDSLSVSNYITVYPQPPSLFVVDNGDTLTANQGFASYQWYLNTTIINGATDYFYLAQASGDYNVIATDSNGCEVEAAIYNVIVSTQSAPGIWELAIFPNPVADELTVHIPIAIGTRLTAAAPTIKIYNIIGEKIYSAVYREPSTVNCEPFPSGMYWLEVSSSEKTFRAKIIKR